MKRIVVLGATGSIGRNALDIVRHRPADFRIIGISGFRNVRLLARQVREFSPRLVCVSDVRHIAQIKKIAGAAARKVTFVLQSEGGLSELATHPEADIVLVATTGTVSLIPTVQALTMGKRVALANKEPLVMAGHIIMDAARTQGALLVPVDSEHSAVFQCLNGESPRTIGRIVLTGSGGPFRTVLSRNLRTVTPEMALQHPKWKMGRKITIDSATLMNKGLELIEACWLFSLPAEQVDVLIHPEAIVHSLVEYCDGAVMAQLGVPDMRLPIQYAFDYPQRMPSPVKRLQLHELRQLTFEIPRFRSFPCLRIAQDVARQGGSGGCVMNAANEVAVEAFLNRTIGFTGIPRIIETVVSRHRFSQQPALTDILELDRWARKEAQVLCG